MPGDLIKEKTHHQPDVNMSADIAELNVANRGINPLQDPYSNTITSCVTHPLAIHANVMHTKAIFDESVLEHPISEKNNQDKNKKNVFSLSYLKRKISNLFTSSSIDKADMPKKTSIQKTVAPVKSSEADPIQVITQNKNDTQLLKKVEDAYIEYVKEASKEHANPNALMEFIRKLSIYLRSLSRRYSNEEIESLTKQIKTNVQKRVKAHTDYDKTSTWFTVGFHIVSAAFSLASVGGSILNDTSKVGAVLKGLGSAAPFANSGATVAEKFDQVQSEKRRGLDIEQESIDTLTKQRREEQSRNEQDDKQKVQAENQAAAENERSRTQAVQAVTR